MNTSGFFKLNLTDVGKGLVTAMLAGAAVAIFTMLNSVFSAPNFDVFSIDWNALVHAMINAAIIGGEGGFAGYLGKNLLTDQNGALMGRWGGKR